MQDFRKNNVALPPKPDVRALWTNMYAMIWHFDSLKRGLVEELSFYKWNTRFSFSEPRLINLRKVVELDFWKMKLKTCALKVCNAIYTMFQTLRTVQFPLRGHS